MERIAIFEKTGIRTPWKWIMVSFESFSILLINSFGGRKESMLALKSFKGYGLSGVVANGVVVIPHTSVFIPLLCSQQDKEWTTLLTPFAREGFAFPKTI
jgi:hypothetical protein